MLWLVALFVLMGIPGNAFPKVITFKDWMQPDKVVHIFLFGILVFLALKSFKTQYHTNSQRLLYIGILLAAIAIGGITELLQYYVFIGRSGNIFDFGADAVGCLLGMVLFNSFERKNLKET